MLSVIGKIRRMRFLKQFYEYLVKLPVVIGKEVTKKELELIVSVK